MNLLCFNIDHKGGDHVAAKKGIAEVLQRTQPSVIAFQECGWKKTGRVLSDILVEGYSGSRDDWEIVEQEETGNKHNTVIFDSRLFSAQELCFDDLGIKPDCMQRRSPRLEAKHKGAPWLRNRYVLLQLTSRTDPSLQFLLINWHGLSNALSGSDFNINTQCLLERAAKLAEQVRTTVAPTPAASIVLATASMELEESGMP